MLLFKDKMNPEGELSIFVDYHEGKGKELIFQEQNLIVKASKQYILSSIVQSGVPSDPIRQLRIGSGGVIDPAGRYPKQEDPLQIDLSNTVISISVTPVIDMDTVTATFLADLGKGEANGIIISEAGLFKESGSIFNIKNHPGIPKTSDFSIHYEWRIRVL